jgi:hypothetical protein
LSSATAGSCARATRTPRSATTATPSKGPCDAYSWQTVERKARFIAQIMRGRLDVREIDDIGDSALSFAEVKALASGDPLILDKAAADAERTRLERLQRAYQRNQHALARTSASAEARFERTARELAAIQAAIAQRVDTRGDAFRMTIGERHAIERPQAADLIRDWITDHARGGIPYGRPQHPLGEVGELGGFRVDAALKHALSAAQRRAVTARRPDATSDAQPRHRAPKTPSRSCASSSDASTTSPRPRRASRPPASPPPKKPPAHNTASHSRSSTPTR